MNEIKFEIASQIAGGACVTPITPVPIAPILLSAKIAEYLLTKTLGE